MAELASNDTAVQATNDDATLCKRYAVQRGYWKDDFIQCFCKSTERKSPEISRGYYARVAAIRGLMNQFVTCTQRRCQVVNLGAGFDTTYWQAREQGWWPQKYVEVDFSEVTSKKCYYVRTSPTLLDLLELDGKVEISQTEVSSCHYHLLAADLRDIGTLEKKLSLAGIDKSLPTLFVAECVLVYMEPEQSRRVIHWAGSHFMSAMFLIYDPIHPFDSFGKRMQDNLSVRGCALLGIGACPDLESQRKRFLDNGWCKAWALDMEQVYGLLPKNEIQRIERLDFLDERELLTQLLEHYTLCCGYNDTTEIGLDLIQVGLS